MPRRLVLFGVGVVGLIQFSSVTLVNFNSFLFYIQFRQHQNSNILELSIVCSSFLNKMYNLLLNCFVGVICAALE